MPKIEIETDYVEKLAELLARTGLSEIEICQGEARIRVARQVAATVEYVHAPAPGATAVAAAAVPPPAPGTEPGHPGTVTSPMVGTAYLCPEPGAPAFVKVGDQVKEGQTLLIIEAMKVMNQIRAPQAGRVTHIFASNAGPVEYGEPLLVIE
ncbi:MAG: acetyl-CoA carboxylase biotin carboxyl carrier protein [Geminicoccaceae bacterium]